MKLIIKQYLSLLKESDELDNLIPDLLLSMGIVPISKAQKGVRQNGVDVSGVGKDENGKKTLFLFTLKQGDIGRIDWDSGVQAVRPSLNEIKDVYLTSKVNPKHKKLPKKIILCTGGDLKQEVQSNWDGYVKSYYKEGIIDYDFWGGDRLSFLIEKHLFNEQIVPEEFRSRFRKVLALISDPDYDLYDYCSILDGILFNANYGDLKKQSNQKRATRAFRTINLCQNIVYFWAKSENNLKPAILCSERTLLNTWEFVRKNDLCEQKKVISIFYDVYRTLFKIYSDYFNKVQHHCYVHNGFCGHGRDYIQECLNVFEHLGFLSIAGNFFLFESFFEKNEKMTESIKIVGDAVKSFIKNHLATRAPCYDGHIIEISSAILILSALNEDEFIEDWIKEITNEVTFAYKNMGKYFPIQSDSFDDLVAMNISETKTKEEMFELSTLLPILAQWCIALGFENTYQFIQKSGHLLVTV